MAVWSGSRRSETGRLVVLLVLLGCADAPPRAPESSPESSSEPASAPQGTPADRPSSPRAGGPPPPGPPAGVQLPGRLPEGTPPPEDPLAGDSPPSDPSPAEAPGPETALPAGFLTTADGQPLAAALAAPADPALGRTPYEVPLPSWMSPLPEVPGNPLTHAGVDLGRHLFYDPLLSGGDTMSCASCHHQESSFADRRGTSLGETGTPLSRNAMPLVNLAWTAPYFWDGRVPTLEALVPQPIVHPDEMNEDMDHLLAQLRSHPDYPARFEAAFPGEGIGEDTLSKAISQFLRTLVSFNSRADLLDAGLAELTELEARGNALMVDGLPKGAPDRVQDICDACHTHSAGVTDGGSSMGLFTTSELKSNGLSLEDGDRGADGRFLVPTIRNLTVTAPYMHDGRLPDLMAVVEHYNSQMLSSAELEAPLAKDGQARQMGLTAEDKLAVAAMIGVFTDPHFLTNPAYASPFPTSD